jgi:hypothetical protein
MKKSHPDGMKQPQLEVFVQAASGHFRRLRGSCSQQSGTKEMARMKQSLNDETGVL